MHETNFSFSYPRPIDGDECNSIEKAFEIALDLLKEGAEKVSVGSVVYHGEDGNGFWGDDGTHRIEIDASECDWIEED